MKTDLYGTGIALVTPFDLQGKIDFPALGRIVESVVGNGVEYLVVLGTTGESVTLNKDEKAAVLKFVIETNKSRAGVVLGVGGNNTAEVIESLHKYDLKGVDAILSVSPYYNKPTQDGIFQHYNAFTAECSLPVILYNVPGRTGANMTSATTLKIAEHCRNVVAIKEASGNLSQIMEIIKNKPEGFNVISGDDNLTYPMMSLGAIGVISVVGQAYPKQFSNMVRLCLSGDLKQARQIHYSLYDFVNYLFMDGSPGGIKAALNVMGLCEEYQRLPLVPVGRPVYKMIQDFIKAF
jgi:4-hydroxy-tetrahydrodipicolinate synthase